MDTPKGPIHSRFDDDPAYADAIDAFIVRIAERVDTLQDIEAGGDLAGLAVHVAALGGEAQHLGYPLLAQSAGEVANAARERNGELARKTLRELTDIARRVRQAHRGSL